MNANEFWIETFGDVDYAYDFAGFRIKRNHYNNRRSELGWNIDHLIPLSLNGLNSKCNKAIANITVNDQKANKTSFGIEYDGQVEYFQVKKVAKNPKRGTQVILLESNNISGVVWETHSEI